MKGNFDIPSQSNYFSKSSFSFSSNNSDSQNRGESNKKEETKFKISFFEKQVDTVTTRRIISHYEFYNCEYSRDKDKCGEFSNKECCFPQAPNYSDKGKILQLDEEKLSDILQDLLHYNIKKRLFEGTNNESHLKIDVRPCEVKVTQSGLKGSIYEVPVDSNESLETKRMEESSVCEETPSSTAIGTPLSTLESFIKTAMDDSLAKLKEEIDKAINSKFESFKSVSNNTCLSNNLNGLNADDSKNEIPSNGLNPEDKKHGPPDMYGESSLNTSSYKILLDINHTPQESFKSESINVIKTKRIGLKKVFENSLRIIAENSRMQKELPNTSKVMIETSLIPSGTTRPEITSPQSTALTETKDGSTNVESSDTTSKTIEAHISSNQSTGNSKKSNNPPLVNDMAKFMCIIFESFKRINEENMKRKLLEKQMKPSESSISSDSSNSTSTSSSASGSKDTSVEQGQTSEDTNVSQEKKSKNTNISDRPIAEVTAEHLTTLNQGDHKEIDNILKINPTVPNIVTVAAEEVLEPVRPIIPEKDLGVEETDLGYTVQKFVKSDYNLDNSSKSLEERGGIHTKNVSTLDEKCSPYNRYQIIIKDNVPVDENTDNNLDSKFYCNIIKSKSKEKVSGVKCVQKLRSKGSNNVISIRHSLIKNKHRGPLKSSSRRTDISLGSTLISLLDINGRSKSSWMRKFSSFCTYSSSIEQTPEKINLLKRLCIMTFSWGRKGKISNRLIDQHLLNIYNAICLDFVTDDVYRSVLFISEHLRKDGNQTKEEIMKRWVKICNKPLVKEKKAFSLDCLHQIWTQFRMKICNLARPQQVSGANFFPALTFPTEENRYIKEQVIQKYARDILEYISDPRLYKRSLPTL